MLELKPQSQVQLDTVKELKNFERTYIFPFFINNVKHEFFSSYVTKQNKFISYWERKKEEKISKRTNGYWDKIHKTTTEQGILFILNEIFTKIVGDTGTNEIELFDVLNKDENNKSFFVTTDEENNLHSEILGDYHINKRFSYRVNVNQNCYLSDFIKGMKFDFYYDETLNKIDGAIIWESKAHETLNPVQSIEKFYFTNFIYTFIKEQFFPFSLDSFLNLFRHDKEKSHYKEEHIMPAKVVDFGSINLNHLQQSWQDLIEKNFAHYSNEFTEAQVNFLKRDLFYEVLMVMLIMCLSVEEVKNFFTSENPEELLGLIGVETHKNSNIERDLSGDFLSVVRMVMNIVETYKNRKVKKIKENHLSRLSKTYDYYYFCDPVILYKSDITKRINPNDLKDFIEQNEFIFYTLFTMLFSDVFRLDSIQNMSTLHETKTNFLRLLDFDKSNYIRQMEECICENDLYTHSFIKGNTIVIFSCDSKQRNKTIKSPVPYYLWAEVFIQSRIFEMKLINEVTNEIRDSGVKWKNIMYRKVLRDMQDIYYDDQNHFYGLTNMSNIVNSINIETDFENVWNELYANIQFEDELHKRGTERSNFMLSFIIAISVGYLNYFSMVFSATSDSQIVGMGWPGIDGHYPWVFTAIAAGACVELINMCVLVYAQFKALYTKRYYKLIDEHKFDK